MSEILLTQYKSFRRTLFPVGITEALDNFLQSITAGIWLQRKRSDLVLLQKPLCQYKIPKKQSEIA